MMNAMMTKLALTPAQRGLWQRARQAGVNAIAMADTTNLGDDIQAEAARRFFQTSRIVKRDDVSGWGGEETCVVLCGWWSRPMLPEKARVVVVGMHLAPEAIAQMDADAAAWDRLRQAVATQGFPAGARDLYTLAALRARGIDAEFSGCVTQTLEVARPVAGGFRSGLRLAVDIAPPGPDWQHGTHRRDYLSGWQPEARLRHAAEQLAYYAEADCIHTTRLHCALPAVALGVPEVRLAFHPRTVGCPERLSGFLPEGEEPRCPPRLLGGSPPAKAGASWVLVGNGPSVLKAPRGARIDSFDEVVRFNRYKIDGYAMHTGCRTTLWAFCGNAMAPLDADQQPARGLCVHGAPAWQPEYVWRIPRPFYDARRAEIQRRSLRAQTDVLLPSCGFLTACWLLDSGTAAKVTLAGFDHFSRKQSGLHHYWLPQTYAEPREHDGAVERDILAEYARQGRLAYLA